MIRTLLPFLTLTVLAAHLAGCGFQRRDTLRPPNRLVAPYDTTGGAVLWAVAPLRNESGTTAVETATIADKLAAAVTEVEGLTCLPFNRTLEAMRELGMRQISSPADARRLAQKLGVDGLLVGTVTAYDPYQPALGLSIALFARPGVMTSAQPTADPRSLSISATESRGSPAAQTGFADAPIVVVSEHLDGKSHAVLMDVRNFADGRHDPASALGWRRYTASMPHFEEFGAHHVVGKLMEREWARVTRPTARGAEQDLR